MALGSGCAGWWRWQWRWPLPTAQKSGWAGRDRADPEFPPILFLSHPLSSEPHWKGEWEREPLALPAQRGLCSGIAGSESGTQSPVLPCPPPSRLCEALPCPWVFPSARWGGWGPAG